MGPGSIGVNGTEQVSLPVGDVPETPSAGRRSVRTFTSSLVDRSLRFSAVEILQQEPVSPTESQPMETEAAAGQDRAVRRSAPERERESGLPSPRHDPPVISPGSQAMPAGIAHLDIRTAHAVFTQPHLLTGGTHRGFGSVVCHAACSADASAMAVYQSGTLTLFGKNASGGWEASGGWVVQCPPFIHRAFGSDGRAQRCTGAPFTMLFSRGGQHFVLEDTHGMALYQRMGATWLRWVVPRDSVIYSKKGCALDPSGRWMALCLEGAAINDKEERIPALFIGLWRFFANWGWQARSVLPRPLPFDWGYSSRLTMVFSPDGQRLAFAEARGPQRRLQVCVLSATSQPPWKVPVVLPFEPLSGQAEEDSVSGSIDVLMFSCSGKMLAAAGADGVHYWKKDEGKGWETCPAMANPAHEKRWSSRIVFCVNGVRCCAFCDSGDQTDRSGPGGC
ncbi:MAG: hypothetical protein OXC07_03150 [Kistimonas sp.]|nr:hypothetical protein [Kistimonas sp.]